MDNTMECSVDKDYQLERDSLDSPQSMTPDKYVSDMSQTMKTNDKLSRRVA